MPGPHSSRGEDPVVPGDRISPKPETTEPGPTEPEPARQEPATQEPGEPGVSERSLAEVIGVPFADLTRLIGRLTGQRLTVATAESLSGGLLAALLTEVPGSSAVVRGGVVVYATDLKHDLAGVDAALLAARGPVDGEVAAALAAGARRRCGADIGIGLTGVAGPDPQNGVPVGTWFVAISGPGGHQRVRRSGDGPAAVRTRTGIRAAAVRAALALLANATAGAATDS